jgi:hypothetical protein
VVANFCVADGLRGPTGSAERVYGGSARLVSDELRRAGVTQPAAIVRQGAGPEAWPVYRSRMSPLASLGGAHSLIAGGLIYAASIE